MAPRKGKSGVPNGDAENGNVGNESDAGGNSNAVNDAISDTGLIIIDPGSIGSGGGDIGNSGDNSGTAPKRRGRKPGSTSTKKSQTLDISGIESILLSAHAILAGIAKTPELVLDPMEAKQLAAGIANVSRHYDVTATEKTMDIINLAMTAGMIYGTRLIATRQRKKAENAERPQPQQSPQTRDANSNVVQIPGVGRVDTTTGVLQP